MDLFEKELMATDTKSSVKQQEKTRSIFPVDNDIIADANDYATDNEEHTKLLYIMRERPVDREDKYKLDLFDRNMNQIIIVVDGVGVKRASDVTENDLNAMGLKLPDKTSPFEVYTEHMRGCGVLGIEPNTYVYNVTFHYTSK